MKAINLRQSAGFRNAAHFKGAAIIEFALVMILLLMIVGAIIEFGRALCYYNVLTKATRDGVRLMTLADKNNLTSAVSDATGLVVMTANDARLSPPLQDGNVWIECKTAGQWGDCVNGIAPELIRVSIDNFNLNLGGWMPIIFTESNTNMVNAVIAPHTTMRYMR